MSWGGILCALGFRITRLGEDDISAITGEKHATAHPMQ